MNVAIVKYNAGNTYSVILALQRLGIDAFITDDIETLRSADKVIFPGVGEASSAMKYLKERGLDTLIKELVQPVLGICLGMQLMCSHSEEGDTNALGIFENNIRRFESHDFKVPHIGWNNIQISPNNLWNEIVDNSFVYFVHSYYAEHSPEAIASCNYADKKFSAALNKNNFYGVQFHPEKSGDIGSKMLGNFLAL